MVSQKVWGCGFCRFIDPFSMDLLEATPAFVHCSELGGSAFRGTDLLGLVRNQLVP